MARLEIEGYGSYEVTDGTRLVNAIEASGVDISHRCGGFAGCTTCRVAFVSGEPQRITRAEADKLERAGLSGEARLACQCLAEGTMHLRVLMPVSQEAWEEPGPAPEATITPDPEWLEVDQPGE